MAARGLKPLSYAYKSMSKAELESYEEQYDTESEDFLSCLLCNLVYLGTFGLKDEMRPDVKKSVQKITLGKEEATGQ